MSSTSDQFPYLIVTPSVNIILYCKRLNIIYVTRSLTAPNTGEMERIFL